MKISILTEEEFDSILLKLYLGTKDKINLPESPEPFNVMKLIDAADHFLKKKYGYTDNKFRKGYDQLSELTHPNSFGYFLGRLLTNTWHLLSLQRRPGLNTHFIMKWDE